MTQDWTIVAVMIFVAMVCGWLLGRHSSYKRHDGGDNHSLIHSEYIRGLNYVLNEQPDKAIEVFVKMLEVDSDTVETHLALGNLFRHRGEVDRAIRIHQNLIARPSLNREQRDMALLELGMDYMRSGLLDRAEGLFQELVKSGSYPRNAHKQLLEIYQQERDWQRAIDTAENLQSVTGTSLSAQVAQFHCEQAEEAIHAGKISDASQSIRKALRMDPDCVRASLIEGKLAQKEGRHRQAIKSFLRIEKQDPAFIREIVEPIEASYLATDKAADYHKFLTRVVDEHGSIPAVIAMVRLIADRDGIEAASRYIMEKLQERPSIRGVDQLVEYVMQSTDGETRASLGAIKTLTERLLNDKSLYKCQHCGFDAKLLHWQCPSCKNWAVVKPIQGVAGK